MGNSNLHTFDKDLEIFDTGSQVFASFGASARVPTIELSVNARKIPDTRILKGIFKSRFISGGLVEEDGELWNTDGELVAISRQVSKYRKTKN